jgi:hypothetical protein
MRLNALAAAIKQCQATIWVIHTRLKPSKNGALKRDIYSFFGEHT